MWQEGEQCWGEPHQYPQAGVSELSSLCSQAGCQCHGAPHRHTVAHTNHIPDHRLWGRGTRDHMGQDCLPMHRSHGEYCPPRPSPGPLLILTAQETMGQPRPSLTPLRNVGVWTPLPQPHFFLFFIFFSPSLASPPSLFLLLL